MDRRGMVLRREKRREIEGEGEAGRHKCEWSGDLL